MMRVSVFPRLLACVSGAITGWMPILLFLIVLVGCGGQGATPKTSLFEDDHAVAAHWPSDLADVAVKLRERLSDSDANPQSLAEIKDLVSWTAEVAADTNLSEADWLPLYKASESLMTDLRAAKDGLSSDDRSQIEALCQLIVDAAPKIPEQLANLKVTSP
ncbi:hypothetical protein CA13_60430 [Planctomycetes bacterium CA13]|uniref:Uncharacterized protein n=1 Tax=Novipirellula herctigrandis TaxID=2527986 RepID=A0A5C5ZDE9_9BACT|nr:hypothetical protein CA13_60430 [Planctomycetes bacterium CA13]